MNRGLCGVRRRGPLSHCCIVVRHAPLTYNIRDIQIRVRVQLSNFKSVTSPELVLLHVVYQQITRPYKQDWCDKLLSEPHKLDLKSRIRSQI